MRNVQGWIPSPRNTEIPSPRNTETTNLEKSEQHGFFNPTPPPESPTSNDGGGLTPNNSSFTNSSFGSTTGGLDSKPNAGSALNAVRQTKSEQTCNDAKEKLDTAIADADAQFNNAKAAANNELDETIAKEQNKLSKAHNSVGASFLNANKKTTNPAKLTKKEAFLCAGKQCNTAIDTAKALCDSKIREAILVHARKVASARTNYKNSIKKIITNVDISKERGYTGVSKIDYLDHLSFEGNKMGGVTYYSESDKLDRAAYNDAIKILTGK